MISRQSHLWLSRRYPERVDEVLRELERRAVALAGLEGRVRPPVPASLVERLAMVIKLEGIYRDRGLYDYVVGPQYLDFSASQVAPFVGLLLGP